MSTFLRKSEELKRVEHIWRRARSRLLAGCAMLAVASGVLLPAITVLAAQGDAPVLTSAASRKLHGAVGTFDLALSLTATNPTTDPRVGSSATIVFTFDKAVTNGTAVVTEGTAVPGSPTFSGNDMIVPLTGVTDRQYVTVAVTNVVAADGSTGGSGAVRVGYLAGDVSQNRVVTLSDLGQVNAQIAQFVTGANFLKDVNASGTLTLADKGITSSQVTKALSAPPPPANQPPRVSAGANQTITLAAGANLSGSGSDDGLPSPPSLSFLWTKVSGPGTVNFGTATEAAAFASFDAAGSYVLRLTADDGALSNFADVTIDATTSTANKMLLTMTGLPEPIEVLSFREGANQLVGTGGVGKVEYSDARFITRESAASPLQLSWLSLGQAQPRATLQVPSAITSAPMSEWTFSNVRISLVAVAASGVEGTLVDFGLQYTRIEYRVFAENGSVVQQMCWNVPSNSRC